jgi:hypothetical protein
MVALQIWLQIKCEIRNKKLLQFWLQNIGTMHTNLVVFFQFGSNILLLKIFLNFDFDSLIFNIAFMGYIHPTTKKIIKLLSTNYLTNCENDYHYLKVVCILKLGPWPLEVHGTPLFQ